MFYRLKFPRLAAAFLAALACGPRVYCQSATTGALAGTITTTDGAAVPSATVAILRQATNWSQTTVSDSNGRYGFALLAPGTYEVEFRAPGFKTAAMSSITVNVSEAPVLDARMEPGNPAERVRCQCRVSTATASSGALVDGKTITSVPLNTRNLTQVLSMASGSAADVNNAGTLGRGTQSVNVNGNTTSGSYTVDGAAAPSAVPNPDTISEFKIQTSNYDAVYGAQVPSTNLITKSGQNEWHGGGWEFVRNDIFNANAFFRNATGQGKPNLKQNQFGATLGGPILKSRWFFFGSYQGTRQVNGLDATSISNVILPQLTADRSASALAAAFCPANHVLTSGSNAGQPDPRYSTFAGGRQLDCRNQSTATTAPISPVALRILQARSSDGSYMIPVPQTILSGGANDGLGFSAYSLPSTYGENQYMLNSDYLASRRNTISWRGYLATMRQYRSFASPGSYPGAPILPGGGTPQAGRIRDYVVGAKLTSVLSTNLVNEARMSFTHSAGHYFGEGAPLAAPFGITPVDPLLGQPPEITVLGPLGSFRVFGSAANDHTDITGTYSWSDNLSWIHGKQTVRGGVFLLRQDIGRQETGAARGKITFQTFSDFLLGLSAADNQSPAGRSNVQSVQANEGVGPNGEVQYRYRSYYGAAYVQDDWKIRPTLTLNLGLRWEYVGPSIDTAGTIGNMWPSLLARMPIPPASGTLIGNTLAANYNPDMVNPYTGRPFGLPPTGVLVRSTSSFYENDTPLATLAPRVALAWQPLRTQGRISVRGGYGWFYSSPTFSGNAAGTPMFTAPPFAQGFTNTDASNNLSSLEKPFPSTTLGYVPRTPTSQLSDRIAGPVYRVPRLQQWNFNVQGRLSRTLSIDLGYVGSRGSRLLTARGLNQPLLASPDRPVNCGYTGSAADCIVTNTSLNAKLRVPFLGETPTALGTSEFAGGSTYHSLQATLRQQVSRGLAFQAAYTFSRAANNNTNLNDQNDTSQDWARASFDRRERLVVNFDYQVPALQRHGAAGWMLRGWSLAGIAVFQSGLPMTLTDPRGGSVYGRAGTSTVTLCPGASYGGLVTSGSAESRLGRWIDTSAICAPAGVGSDGASGYGTTGLSIMNGPGQVNTDVSLGKTTRVGGLREDAILGFRVEFYNVLNHPQFSNPGTTYGTATFGVVTQTSIAPRLIQFGLKYIF